MKKIFLSVFTSLLSGLIAITAYSQQVIFVTTSNAIGIIPNPSTPGSIIGPFPVSGLGAGQNIEGIDFRPNTGELYALGYNSVTQEARLYTISQQTGMATPIGASPVILNLVAGKIGFDFNPTVDRIRVLSSNGSNYRLHPTTGAIAATDGNLAFNGADVNSAQASMAVSSAYTKSYIGTESTTLYNVDFGLNILTTQNPPNNGTQNTVGSLGITINNSDPTVGFDFFFDNNTQTEIGYITANPTGTSNDNLYTVNATTGTVTNVGIIGSGIPVRDMAVVIDRTLPPVSGILMYALTQTNGNLISFDSENPNVIRSLVPITGITAGQATLGMDFRPLNGELFVFGYNTGAANYQLYKVDKNTGVATAVNASPVALMLNGGLAGFDFNPTVDRIRLTSATGQNFRLNPLDGSIAGTDMALNYAVGDVNQAQSPYMATVAYTNSYAGSTTTTLFGYDDMLNVIATIAPPNNGTINTLGSSGLITGAASYTSDMDVYFDSTTNLNQIYFVTNTGSSTNDFLYRVSNTTFTQVGRIGFGVPVKDIAAIIGSAPALPPVLDEQIVFATGNSIGIIPNPAAPGTIIGPFPVTGLTAGQNIEGIDFRPNTGELYALGYNAGTMEARLYIIDQSTAAATPIGAGAVVLNLSAGKIGFDFNPTVDRIRVISANGMNYRLHPTTGAIAATDGNLAFAAGDVNAAQTSMAVSAAYSKSYIGTESTTLYNIDFGQNILTTQVPPNSGTQNTIGDLGIDIDNINPSVGFDLFFDEAAQAEVAYISANLEGFTNDNLFTLNLTNGTVTNLGIIGTGLNVRDMAVVIDRTLPALTGVEIYALSQNAGAGNLISFDSENPEIIRTLVPITGITAGQNTLGMDFRPATGELFIFGYNATASNYQLYTVNKSTGAATAINSTPVALTLDTALVGFDFNPTVDRIRLVGAGGENFRLNPIDGSIAATDGDLEFAAGDANAGTDAFIATVAYTNSYPGATSTTLFAYDDMLNILVTILPPNNGVCNTQGSSGLVTGMASYTSDMDIYFDSVAYANKTFFVTNTGSSLNDFLYTVSGSTFTSVGRIGFGVPVKDIAIGIGGTPFDLAIGESGVLSDASVSVYPNPASSIIFIKTEGMQGQSFSIMDVTGRIITSSQTIQENIQTVSLEAFSSGVYFVRFENGKTTNFIIR